ncbi:MAG TPA: thiol reductant ABC exporter subunit CydD [Pseudogracilibacillus sp.]|nr:thiol reductant ABC exporter subunit CydD [Pseudogracilibacillus sp.]
MNTKRKKGLPMYSGAVSLYSWLVLLLFGESIAIIAQAYFLAFAITQLFNGDGVGAAALNIYLFLGSFAVRYIFQHIAAHLSEKHALQTASHLRESLFHTYFHKQDSLNTGTGHFITLAMEGVDQVKTYIEIIGVRMIKTMILPALIAVFVFTIDKKSAFILIGAVPVIIVFMILLGLAAEKKADKQYTTYKRLSNHFLDSLRGLETLAYIGRSKQHGKQIGKVSEDYRKATMRTLRVAFLSSFALDFFTSLSIAFVAVGLGLRLIDGTVLLFPALTILILAPEYFSPIKQVGKDYHATLDGQIAMAEIEQVLQMEPHSKNTKEVQVPRFTKESSIRLKGITVTKEESTLLHPVDVTMTHGFHGLIGTSGAGKTTLLQVLAGRITPSDGHMELDGTDFASLDYKGWADQVAYIPQHPYIFPLTLAENIRFYEPSIKDSKIEQLIYQIGLGNFVESLPNGMEEKIGEGGRSLSGGQAQRVALARALVSNKSVILLDEPTAHLDIETEYEVKELILNLFQDKFVLIATHRLHWLTEMDAVYKIKDGFLSEQTTHKARHTNHNRLERGTQYA